MRREDFERLQPPTIDRPSDRWVCGHADHGQPCAHGPTASGVCSAMGACHPMSHGNGWSCARPVCLGGKCDEGPDSDGRCGRTPRPCRPRRSWHYRRRRIVVAGMLIACAAWTFLLAGSWRSKMLRPGMLSQSHAQILGAQVESARCAACHPAAKESLRDWFFSAGSEHKSVTQSQLCLDCHHTTLAKDRAMMAHNLTLNELHLVAAGRSRWHSSWRDAFPGPAVDLEHVHCAACHREHHGAAADLTRMSNSQCQTCHQDRFQSFAADHPDWQDWPYEQEGIIAFDHAAHYGKHFGATDAKGIEFQKDCRTCHERTAEGEIARVGDYATTCAACHDDAMRLEANEGVTLLAIPSLPMGSEEIGSWPKAASGFYDGRVGPLTRLLISDRGRVSEALSRLPEDGDLAKIDPSDARLVSAANDVAVAIMRLMSEISQRGNAAISERLRRQNIPEATAGEVARHLSPQLVLDARERWFGQTSHSSPEQGAAPESETLESTLSDEDSLLDNDLLLDEDALLSDDPLATDPLQRDPLATADGPHEPHRSGGKSSGTGTDRDAMDIESLLTQGGWFQDDRRLAIRYGATEHADPVLRRVIDVAVALPREHPVRDKLLSLRSTASCIRCHQIDPELSTLRWNGQRTDTTSRRFTKFSHQPHLHLPGLENCTQCHRVRGLERQTLTVRLTATDVDKFEEKRQFEPLTRQTCSACHRAGAAGDSCTKCHLYHVDPIATPFDPG